MLPEQFRIIETSDADELAERLGGLVGRASPSFSGRNIKNRYRVSHMPLGDISILHGDYQDGLQIRFADLKTFAGSSGPINGVGEHTIARTSVAVSKGRGVVISPGEATLRYGPGFEHLSLVFQPAAMIGKLAAIVGDLRLGPLRFVPAVNGGDPHSARLNRLVHFIVEEARQSWPLPALLQAELQQAVTVAFLLANTSNYSPILRADSVPASRREVRVAEQYIEANWDMPITIEALVAVTGVSARSLFAAFRTERGYTPMEFVKSVRLRIARQSLSRADRGQSVSTVAVECGFGNLGHFAKDYRRQFGELPSATLARAQDRAAP